MSVSWQGVETYGNLMTTFKQQLMFVRLKTTNSSLDLDKVYDEKEILMASVASYIFKRPTKIMVSIEFHLG